MIRRSRRDMDWSLRNHLLRFGPVLKQDLGWCPQGAPGGNVETRSFRGPFRSVVPCLETGRRRWRSRCCLMFITESQMIITPVPQQALHADPDRGKPAGELHRENPITQRGLSGNRDTGVLLQLDEQAKVYAGSDPETVFVAEPDARVISLDTIQEIVITWVRSSHHYSRLLFPFGMYPAEPGNASYRADYQISIVTGTTNTTVVTPFSWELKQALKDLLGERVREVSEVCAPIL